MKKIDYKWIVKIVVIAFCLSGLFTLISETAIPHINIIFGLIVTVLIITIGVLFDMIGVAVTTASETPFHSMASKKVKGSKISLWLIKNADKVSSFCCDVIGDICGIITGVTGVAIVTILSERRLMGPIYISLIVLVSSCSSGDNL